MTVNFDIQTSTHALLTLPDGQAYDVDGDNRLDLRASAEELAQTIGATKIVWNWELPE